MFALWYLSFAFDEMRKHFGWFFDNFKLKGGKNAIENKQPTPPQPQSAPQTKPQPQAQPEPQAKPQLQPQAKPQPQPQVQPQAKLQPAVTKKVPETKPQPEPKPAVPETKPAPPETRPAARISPPTTPTQPKPAEKEKAPPKTPPATPPTTPTESPTPKSKTPQQPSKKGDTLTDALDRKLQEVKRPFENGGNDKRKADLKDATTGFLQMEAQNGPAASCNNFCFNLTHPNDNFTDHLSLLCVNDFDVGITLNYSAHKQKVKN